jgi:hypothetical protein
LVRLSTYLCRADNMGDTMGDTIATLCEFMVRTHHQAAAPLHRLLNENRDHLEENRDQLLALASKLLESERADRYLLLSEVVIASGSSRDDTVTLSECPPSAHLDGLLQITLMAARHPGQALSINHAFVAVLSCVEAYKQVLSLLGPDAFTEQVNIPDFVKLQLFGRQALDADGAVGSLRYANVLPAGVRSTLIESVLSRCEVPAAQDGLRGKVRAEDTFTDVEKVELLLCLLQNEASNAAATPS